ELIRGWVSEGIRRVDEREGESARGGEISQPRKRYPKKVMRY
ncbi:unnamed protein product, partial [marine sediment metagenome]